MKFHELKTKKARIAHIKEQVSTKEEWAIRGLLRIYERQTEDEQRMGYTRMYNKIGFSGFDGEILSSFAKQIIKGRKMSPKQMAIIFKKMPKYARQLSEIAEEKK